MLPGARLFGVVRAMHADSCVLRFRDQVLFSWRLFSCGNQYLLLAVYRTEFNFSHCVMRADPGKLQRNRKAYSTHTQVRYAAGIGTCG